MIFRHFQLDYLSLHDHHLSQCSLSKLHLANYGKLFSPIIVLKVYLLELKTNTMTLLSTIEFVLVKEVHDESHLTCISKAFDQTAFGPRQISTFISLCLQFKGKQHEIHNFLTICCLTCFLKYLDATNQGSGVAIVVILSTLTTFDSIVEIGEQEASSHAYTLDSISLYSFDEPTAPTLYLLLVEEFIVDFKIVYASFLFTNYHIMANVGMVVLTIVYSKANITSAMGLSGLLRHLVGLSLLLSLIHI